MAFYIFLVDDYYYCNSTTITTLTSAQGNTSIINNTMDVELVLVSGQTNTSFSIATVDDDIVESTESLDIAITHILTTVAISLQITGQNSTSIQISNNDGNRFLVFLYVFNLVHFRNIFKPFGSSFNSY